MMRVQRLVNPLATVLMAFVVAASTSQAAHAEDGYDLWLRYAPLEGEALVALQPFDRQVEVVGNADDPTLDVAVRELDRGLGSMLGAAPADAQGRVRILLDCGSQASGGEGSFTVRATGERAIRIAGPGALSCLYGSFSLLRELAQGADPRSIDLAEAPAMPLRLLNHWDNPDGHVERGYAGRSIFDWWHLPERLDQRMIDYARANASLGINGAVVNTVNASPLFLTPRYLPKLKRLADAWRPYGIRLYVSARFSAPRDVGGLATADPLDPQVRAWWRAKADEIYAAIPDFGGFLVKANSEGQPGPQDYGRTHAEGANMLAEAIGPRGTVIWRAFVYSAEDETDRAKQAYAEFVPLDGEFADNVIVQVKNGAIDFQPREPFHPMFGAMPATRLMLEVQVTKEYLGFASHLAYLAPMWTEVLGAETKRGGTVAQIVAPAGMAGVANTGSDRDWSGSHFDQANWYGLRPARLGSDADQRGHHRRMGGADLFARPCFPCPRGAAHDAEPAGGGRLHNSAGPRAPDGHRPSLRPRAVGVRSRAARVEPVLLPPRGRRRHRLRPHARGQRCARPICAASGGRLGRPGDDGRGLPAVVHHLPWQHRTQSGRTLWDELVHRYDRGVARVEGMAKEWTALAPYVDPPRQRAVAETLAIQQREARWWRDASPGNGARTAPLPAR